MVSVPPKLLSQRSFSRRLGRLPSWQTLPMSQLSDATPAERHRILAERFASLIEGIRDWDAPTPVEEWKVSDLVDHLEWLPGLLATWDVVLDVPHAQGRPARFRAQTEAVQNVLTNDGERIINTGFMGEMTLTEVLERFYFFDLFAHAWDLAKATGQDATLDEDYAAGAYAGMSAMGPALHESGQFGSPQPVADDAPVQHKLIALIGRDPNWSRD